MRLAIVLRKVLSVEKCWNFYLEMKERVETDWKMPYELDCMIGHLFDLSVQASFPNTA